MNDRRGGRSGQSSGRRGSRALEAYWRAWKKLAAMSDDELESERADKIRDDADRFLFAMTPADKVEFDARVKAHLAEERQRRERETGGGLLP